MILIKHIPYFTIKNFWIDNYSKSNYRLGQWFLSLTFKTLGQDAESFYPKYYKLWNENHPKLAEGMIYEIINKYNWDLMNIPVVNSDMMRK